jgi:hypothetical protein
MTNEIWERLPKMDTDMYYIHLQLQKLNTPVKMRFNTFFFFPSLSEITICCLLQFSPTWSKIQQVKSAICNQTYHSQARFVVSLRFARTNMQLVTLCDGFWKLCFLMGSTIIFQIFTSALLCNVTMSKLFTNVIIYITVQNKKVLDYFPFFGQMILVNLLIIEGCCWLKMYILVALFWGLIIDLVSFWCYYFQILFPWFSISVIFICHFLITFVNLTFFIIIHVCFRIIGYCPLLSSSNHCSLAFLSMASVIYLFFLQRDWVQVWKRMVFIVGYGIVVSLVRWKKEWH